jgi:hypothetical protein
MGTSSAISRFRMEAEKADRIEIEAAWDTKIVSSALGLLLEQSRRSVNPPLRTTHHEGRVGTTDPALYLFVRIAHGQSCTALSSDSATFCQ